MQKITCLLYAIIILLFFNLTFSSCKEEPPVVPPPPPPDMKDTITITIVEEMHRSIVVNVKTTTNFPNSFIELCRTFNNTDTLVAEYPITVTDTTILDENNGQDLKINTEYTYYAVRRDSIGEKKDTSNIVTAKTLNAAEFNYTWQELSFGSLEYGPNVLYDVWGSDEDNVWAVGGFYDDNNRNYGALHYDGSGWTPDRTVGGRAIHGFAWNDIWVVGGSVFHFNGVEWKQIDSYTSGGQSIPLDIVLFNNKPYDSAWGTSSSNIYFGNSHGRIIHWDGNKASVVYTYESDVSVNDLDGYSADFIIGVGIGFTPPLLAIYYNGVSWNKLPIENDPSLRSVAIVSRNHIYFAGSGVYEMKGNSFSRTFTSGYFIYDIDYNRQNGITVAAGPFGGVYINNGIEWRNYQGQITTDDNDFVGIFLINDTIFCVGRNDNQAKIIIGKNLET